MIKKVESLVKAEQILVQIQNSDKARDIDCFVDCYENGREQGFQLWEQGGEDGCQAILFAQERRSNQFVVYVGRYSMQSISEEAYKNSRCFSTSEEAAEYALEQALVLFPAGRFGK
jgi:hypothetical protein